MIKFEKLVWLIFLGVCITAGVAFTALCIFVIGTHVGFADTPADWGDFLTLASLILAALVAGGGWYLTHRHKELQTRQEATVQAIILYQELFPTILGTLEALEMIADFKNDTNEGGGKEEKLIEMKNEIGKYLERLGPPIAPSRTAPLLRNDLAIGRKFLWVNGVRARVVKKIENLKDYDKTLSAKAEYEDWNSWLNPNQVEIDQFVIQAFMMLIYIEEMRIVLENKVANNNKFLLELDYEIELKALSVAKSFTGSEVKVPIGTNKYMAALIIPSEREAFYNIGRAEFTLEKTKKLVFSLERAVKNTEPPSQSE